LYSWRKYVGFRVHAKRITITFVTIPGKNIPLPLPSPQIEIEPQYIELGVKVDDWSKAPSNANYLKVYACDSENMWVRAQYEP
jgi:ABC-type protease/lipase transport system fused ATPase/permease subunit